MTTWAIRKAKFNHDRLKNEFMQSLGHFIRILEGRVANEGFVGEFGYCLDAKWRMLRAEAKCLAEEADDNIGIRGWFREYPICRLSHEDKSWMMELIEQFWPPPKDLAEKSYDLNQTLSRVDTTVASIVECFSHYESVAEHGAQSSHDDLLALANDLYRQCYRLSSILSSFTDSRPVDVLENCSGKRRAFAAS